MPAALTYPGVYVEELPSGVHTITGVATSITAFIGWAPQGPVDRAVLVESWPQYESYFGNLYPGVFLGYAVNAFFANGGSQAYIIRLVDPTAVAASVPNAIGSATLYASSPGAWGKGLEVQVVPQTGSTTNFTLNVIDAGSGNVLESWANLSVTPGDPRYAVPVIDTDSQYVTFIDASNPTATISLPTTVSGSTIPAPTLTSVNAVASPAGSLPANEQYWYTVTAFYPEGESEPSDEMSQSTTASARLTLELAYTANPFNGNAPTGFRILRGEAAGAEDAYFMVTGDVTTFDDVGATPTNGTASPATGVPVQLENGSDGAGVLLPNTGGFETALTKPASGVYLLDRVPIFNLLCVPGETKATTIQTLQAYCAANRAFQIVDTDQYVSVASLQAGPAGLDQRARTPRTPPSTSRGSPAPDPLRQPPGATFRPAASSPAFTPPPTPSRGVWKAPAGINAGLTGAIGLQIILTDPQNGLLNLVGINCLRQFQIYGDVVWGARTLHGADEIGSQWKYVPIRRLALFLESSLYQGTQWVVFEPNDEAALGPDPAERRLVHAGSVPAGRVPGHHAAARPTSSSATARTTRKSASTRAS